MEDNKLQVKSKKQKAWAFGFVLLAFCLVLAACSTKSENPSDSSTKFQQYYIQGEQLYLKHCSNCHQENGTGLGRVYPPLDVSDYMESNRDDVICLMRHGKQGELIVNGKNYNQAMPGVPSLTDLEIAEIATYIYNTWQHKRGLMDVKEVSKTLQACPPSQ